METVSVLINTYNYGAFVIEAVDSVLAQTMLPAEIIVVDDGSTDGTCELLAAKYASHPLVKVIPQRNGGQLSAFVTGFEHATGDLILLLDADDTYTPGHISNVVRAFAGHREVDFVFTAHRQFGEENAVVQRSTHDQALGLSLIGALARTLWVGSATSTLGLRRSLVLTLLPALRPLVPQWRIRADDCLVLGASLAGSQKYYLAEPTVGYRVHRKNHFHRRESTATADYAHFLRREKLKSILAAQLGIPADVARHADMEFATIPAPSRREYREYLALVWSLPLSLWSRGRKLLRIRRHFRATRGSWSSAESPAPAELSTAYFRSATPTSRRSLD